MNSERIRQTILLLAEAFDAWRVIPRLMLLAYGYLVFNLYIWYKNIPTYVQEKCDTNMVTALMAKGLSQVDIKQYACSVVDVVGGPTTAQSTFVTTIIGLSTGIFGLYTTTGRKWDGWEPTFVTTTSKGQKTVVSYAPMQVTPDEMLVPEDTSSKTINIYAAGEKAPEEGPKP